MKGKTIRVVRGMPRYNGVLSTAIGTLLTHYVVSCCSTKPNIIVVVSDSEEEGEVKIEPVEQGDQR